MGGEEFFGGTAPEEHRSDNVSEGLMSLAKFLGVPLSKVLELRDGGRLMLAIERRNAARDPAAGLRALDMIRD